MQFQRVVEGETQDAPANVQKAQFFLGKSLYHLRYYQSALAVFDEISRAWARDHLFFDQTLQWLAQLASQLPEPAGIIDKIGRFGVDQLEQFNTADNADLYNQLLYLMGRSKYNQGEFEQAHRAVQAGRPREQVVRARRASSRASRTSACARRSPAVDRVPRDHRGARRGRRRERRRHRAHEGPRVDLARARLLHRREQGRTHEGEREVDGVLLGNAVEAWNSIDPDSEYWLDALFEESWAFFLADEYSRALGNMHTLYSPYFKKSFYPEALVLKAVVFFYELPDEERDRDGAAVPREVRPGEDRARRAAAEVPGQRAVLRVPEEAARGRGQPAARGARHHRLGARRIARCSRTSSTSRCSSRKRRTLNKAPSQFKSSSLGARILQDILVAKSFAIDQAGEIAKARYNRLVDEMQDLANQIDTVEIEVAELRARSARPGAAGADDRGRASPPAARSTSSPEHNVWPFDGEYWRDELGYYRQQVTYKCGR